MLDVGRLGCRAAALDYDLTKSRVCAGAFARAGVTDAEWTAGRWALSGVGLGATLAATMLITRIARRALTLRGASAFNG